MSRITGLSTRRRLLTTLDNLSANGMRLPCALLASSLVSSDAWLPTPNRLSFGASSSHAQLHVGSTRTLSSSTLPPAPRSFQDVGAIADPQRDVLNQMTEEPDLVEGSVVSCFPGGLVAVRADADLFDMNAEQSLADEHQPSRLASSNPSSSSNLSGDLTGRQVVFPNEETGVVVAYRPPIVFVQTNRNETSNVGEEVSILDTLVSVNDKDPNTVDRFGSSLQNAIATGEMKRPLFAPTPAVADIALINRPLVTGVTMFDSLTPIGKGQNMLMIGHDIGNMREYVRNMFAVQKNKSCCIYASTHDKHNIEKMLGNAGLLEEVIVVSNSGVPDETDKASVAAAATITAARACAIAENLAIEKGMDTVVVVDTIDQHKTLWDATTNVLVDEFGIDAVARDDQDGGASSEMRAFFSSLIQRSAQFNEQLGGGSVTILLLVTIPKVEEPSEGTEYSLDDFEGSPAKVTERLDLLVKRNVPLTAANLRKIQIPVPSVGEQERKAALQHMDDLISMSDGQIWLDDSLERRGRQPPMDIHRSVTRIGIGADTASRADAPAIRQVVEGLRLALSQADDLDAADTETNATQQQKRNAQALNMVMHQPASSGARRLSESCIVLLAASRGYLPVDDDGVSTGTAKASDMIEKLLEHVERLAPESMETIDESLDMPDSLRHELEGVISSYFG